MAALPRFSIGIGDRFAREGGAQMQAILAARARGVTVCPVWNKSYREHSIVGSMPRDTREEADAAVREARWREPYFVDADHVTRRTVDGFLDSSDFFTIDVAEAIGRKPDGEALDGFLRRNERFVGKPVVEGAPGPVTAEGLRATGLLYLEAVREAAETFRYISDRKGSGAFVTEVSMDETAAPQSPAELFFILSALAGEGVALQTVAPRFSGRFNKGVEYVGDPAVFERELGLDVAVLGAARREFGLDPALKLSVHSGSDKFAIYPAIRRVLSRTREGVHVKTAGTTWLEELVGLAEAGGEGLRIAHEVYRAAYERSDELCKPYASVIDVDRARLPAPGTVDGWDGQAFAASLRHDGSSRLYNPSFRQLLHVSYRVAAEMGRRFLDALGECREVVSRNVRDNLLLRHIEPLFLREG
jgi:tagaturonate epimerase